MVVSYCGEISEKPAFCLGSTDIQYFVGFPEIAH